MANDLVLSLLLVATNLFWAMLTLKLTNKLMSRSYYEYVQAENLKKPPKSNRKKELAEEEFDPIDVKQAQDMNSLMNII